MSAKLHHEYIQGKWTLYYILGIFMHRHEALPDWVVEAIELGFQDRIEGKRDLDSVFGLTRTPGRSAELSRRQKYSPQVYWEARRRREGSEPIDTELFENIVAEIKAASPEAEWTQRIRRDAPRIYCERKPRTKVKGKTINLALFKSIAADMRATFEAEWPDQKPPSGSTLKKWYDSERRQRVGKKPKKRINKSEARVRTIKETLQAKGLYFD